ncbi:hypothetical protein HPB48_006301 [Haemaphysalis longicornis]|uniref:Fibronectin type-III domain-containing protein n=1 Tax=Haemaphysalis longicornis TaxID=44386 RepID=A0A9J6FXF9_HAELO|nr:hypothetical protein HPB48_006301 [Haemaphysalis longicornis]
MFETSCMPTKSCMMHAPLCKANQAVVYAASRHQEVEVHCEVEADPSNVTFEWRFNSTLQQRPLKSFWVQGNAQPTPSTGRCSAPRPTASDASDSRASSMSSRQVAGPPGPVENCSITNQTEGSLHLECQAGSDGHLPAHFVLSVHDAVTAAVSANFTADRPDFWVHDLLPGVEYFLVVSAVNERGRSPELTILPPIMPLVGKLTKSGSAAKMYSSALLVTVIAAVALLCLLPLVVLAAVKLKGRRFFAKSREAKKDGTDEDACPSTTAATPQEATQLQISSIYPKEDNQVWIVKKSTGL